ncbi:hypothetical protein [Dehalococcoides mccartyi]|jgi:hypothetical protein|uniref:Uncharacterized protein n=1 Tax=Dehalococcoides mccartyi TaxID=61435 RepID=A0AB33HZ16_9CHLR|nr:hypothetical protein [Dehalococcoides mccartyi]BAZ97477.1 hypothetical protein DEHALATV1_0849 [Dehalococcoides mccartyi]
MDPLFSEFSYGYTVTEELATGVLGFQKVRPLFPTQYQEAQPGGGYDVNLPYSGAPMYLQFKRADGMIRTNAKEYHLFNDTYYRMHLMPPRYSPQHELLIHLKASGNDVYYITPEFYTDEELASYYDNRTVFFNSRTFSPSEIGHLSYDEDHYVVYNNSPIAWICSEEPRRLEKSIRGRDFSEQIIVTTRQKSRRVDESFFDKLIDTSINILEKKTMIVDTLKQTSVRRKEIDTLSEKAIFANFLSRAYFGCELFIVGE